LVGTNGATQNDPNDTDPGGNTVMNYPVLDETKIYLSGTQWVVPFSFDVDLPGDYRFELYRYYDTPFRNHEYLASRVINGVTTGSNDFKGMVTLTNGTEMSEGWQLSVLAVRTSGTSAKNSSELSPPTRATIATPRVLDVQISGKMVNGNPWVRSPYSYSSIVPTGKQLAPIYTEGVNTIRIVFNESVVIDNSAGGALKVVATSGNPLGSSIAPTYQGFTGNAATWTIPGELPKDKYRIVLDATKVRDAAGNVLDGEWENITNGTADNFNDDLQGRTFVSGDGVPGSMRAAFEFFFSVLPGDYNQDGVVDGFDDDSGAVKDGDGDGVIENGQGGTSTQDLALASTTYAATYLPLRKNQGDYVDNDWVDGAASLNSQMFDYWTRRITWCGKQTRRWLEHGISARSAPAPHFRLSTSATRLRSST
jgi:hypothetical protein